MGGFCPVHVVIQVRGLEGDSTQSHGWERTNRFGSLCGFVSFEWSMERGKGKSKRVSRPWTILLQQRSETSVKKPNKTVLPSFVNAPDQDNEAIPSPSHTCTILIICFIKQKSTIPLLSALFGSTPTTPSPSLTERKRERNTQFWIHSHASLPCRNNRGSRTG